MMAFTINRTFRHGLSGLHGRRLVHRACIRLAGRPHLQTPVWPGQGAPEDGIWAGDLTFLHLFSLPAGPFLVTQTEGDTGFLALAAQVTHPAKVWRPVQLHADDAKARQLWQGVALD